MRDTKNPVRLQHVHRFAGFVALALAACGGGASGPAPKAEVAETDVKLDLPGVPAFEKPQAHPDGTHSVLEMRRLGPKFLEQDVKVKGFVIWKYDCIAEIGAAAFKESPEKCQKPHFYLGDAPDTTREKAIEVVDVPRPPRDDEKKFLPKEDLKNWPKVPEYQQGQELVVTGKWSIKSPMGFVNSDGLLVYQDLLAAGATPPPAPPPAH